MLGGAKAVCQGVGPPQLNPQGPGLWLQSPSAFLPTVHHEEARRETRCPPQSPAGHFRLHHLHPGGCCPPQITASVENWEHPFLQISGSMVCSSTGKGGCCFEMVFLTVGGGRDPVARDQNLALLPLIKGQPWRMQPEAAGWEQPMPPCSGSQEGPEFSVTWTWEPSTAHSFMAVMGLSFLPRLSLSPGLAFTQNSCSW